jgi:tetratricopeptide (TPR) repeat protein
MDAVLPSRERGKRAVRLPLVLLAGGLLAAGGLYAWQRTGGPAVPPLPPPPADEGQEIALRREFLESLVRAEPNRWLPRVKLASLYMEEGQAPRAVGELLHALQRQPKEPRLLLAVADAARAAAYVDLELSVWTQLAREMPESPRVFVRLAQVYDELGWVVRARQAAARAMQLAPRDPEALQVAAATTLDAGDLKGASALAERLRRVDPGHPVAFSILAQAAKDRSRWAEAIAHARRAVELDPQEMSFRSDLASMLVLRPDAPDYEGAVAVCMEALRLDPQYLPARYWLGVAQSRLGRLTEARDTLEAVRERDAGYLQAGYHLSQVYARLGDPARAEQVAKEYTESDRARRRSREISALLRRPDPPASAHLARAREAYALGEHPRAMAELREVLRKEPKNGEAVSLLLRSRMAMAGRGGARP